VVGDFRPFVTSSTSYTQGYLCSASGCTVRVRVGGDRGYLTIKGRPRGIARFEWEQEIAVDDARKLLELCAPLLIRKTRHLVPAGSHVIEVDEFHAENQGLIVAEVEVGSEEERVELPAWIGEEVTGDSRYGNAALARSPYSGWPEAHHGQGGPDRRS
jgi:CYTH domain-containing protein